MACVGLDLRGFTSDEKTQNIKPLEGWAELTNSPRLRALAIATLVEDMQALSRHEPSGPGPARSLGA